MVDPKLIRGEPETVRTGLKNRGGRFLPALEELIQLDQEHRKILSDVERLRTKRNELSQRVGKAKAANDEARAQTLIAEVSSLKDELSAQEAALVGVSEKSRQAALGLPNLPHDSVPMGGGPEDNPLVREGRGLPSFDFAPLDHQAVGEKLGILDFSAGAKLAGSRFALWRGAGARLIRSLINFQLDLHGRAGYQEVWPPALARPEVLEGTGQLPKFESDLYKTRTGVGEEAHDLYLIPTAEVPLTNLAREQILEEKDLPLKMTAYTPCFRQEAGSYGKDVRGLIRNHQFDKIELVWITRPEDSLAALERLARDAEAVLEALEIPRRVVELCSGDLGFASRKTYDLEVWMPAEGKYREISSCSDCGDFQARRMGARFRRGPKGPPELVHTLNGSGVAVGRLAAAILENFQQKDGSVRVPKALVSYLGLEVISR